MSSYWQSLLYFFRLPFHIQWRTALVQLPRWVPLSILHLTSRKGPQPFIISLPSRRGRIIPIYVFVPPEPVDLDKNVGDISETSNGNMNGATTGNESDEWKVPVILDFHGGGFIMGSPLEQAPYAAMMSRELGAVVISVSYRIGPFHQFPAAIHDAEDVLSAILDTAEESKAGKVLRNEIDRYQSLTEENRRNEKRKRDKKGKRKNPSPYTEPKKIVLDPSRLCISGFSAGGNIALNMAVNVPPCLSLLESATEEHRNRRASRGPKDKRRRSSGFFSPILPPTRNPTIVDDPKLSWPCLLSHPSTQPRLIPLLLFYPSLDARILPHERPMKALPSALKPNDKKTQKPKAPGLFSIMGPTYLPKKLRSHPRASPGLVDAEDFQRNAAIFLVLPENDSLAVQSDVWVDKMNESGWHGPVRFGDGRLGDWDGREVGPRVAETLEAQPGNGGIEVWHAPKCRHGWTQFPTPFLKRSERRERDLVFARTLDFVREKWRKALPVDETVDVETGVESGAIAVGAAASEREIQPLRLPSQFGGLEG